MKTVRHNTYETNSSSTHSITIDTANYKNVQIPKTMTIPLGEFGWEYTKFNDFLTKASYFWTLGLYDADVNDRMIRLAADNGLDLEFKRDNDGGYSYVDHGTEHYSDWVKKNPELLTDEGLWSFLINESCWIILGNDNSIDPPNWRITEKAAKAMPYEVYVSAIDDADFFEISGLKTDRETIAENRREIDNHVSYILDKERGDNYSEPWPRVTDIREEGVVTIEYTKYDYSSKEHKVLRTRKLRAYVIKV